MTDSRPYSLQHGGEVVGQLSYLCEAGPTVALYHFTYDQHPPITVVIHHLSGLVFVQKDWEQEAVSSPQDIGKLRWVVATNGRDAPIGYNGLPEYPHPPEIDEFYREIGLRREEPVKVRLLIDDDILWDLAEAVVKECTIGYNPNTRGRHYVVGEIGSKWADRVWVLEPKENMPDTWAGFVGIPVTELVEGGLPVVADYIKYGGTEWQDAVADVQGRLNTIFTVEIKDDYNN